VAGLPRRFGSAAPRRQKINDNPAIYLRAFYDCVVSFIFAMRSPRFPDRNSIIVDLTRNAGLQRKPGSTLGFAAK